MSDSNSIQAQAHRRRLVRAVAVVVLAVLVIPLLGARVESALESGQRPPASAGLFGAGTGASAERTAAAGEDVLSAPPVLVDAEGAATNWEQDPLGYLDALGRSLESSAVPPPSFMEEAGFPEGCRDVRCNGDENVIGCTLDSSEEEAYGRTREALAARGWSEVPLTGVTGGTFLKAAGNLRWMLVTCSQAGPATAIVYRLG